MGGYKSSPHRTADSVFINHEHCPNCGSRDNLARYSDGHGYCFGCEYYEPGDETKQGERMSTDAPVREFNAVTGQYMALEGRGVSEKTCQFFNYQVGMFDGNPCHIANYYHPEHRYLMGQKIRMANKKFKFLIADRSEGTGLFGQHLWSDRRSLVITEGEIDALSYAQVTNCKYPVVSLQNGASGAAASIQKAYDWLLEFEDIVLAFDNDEPGRKAALEAAQLLPAEKVRIATLEGGYKDFNEALVAQDTQAITKAFFNAKPYRPDGIVSALDLVEDIANDDEPQGLPTPYEGINRVTRGLHTPSMIVLTAGSGVGKSTLARELAYDLSYNQGQRVGMLMLEESTKRTLRSLIGIHLSKNIVVDPTMATPEEIKKAAGELFSNGRNIYLYDHFGSSDVDNIIQRIRYMAKACGCKYIVLDHISILVSGLATGDERKLIDMAMTKLRTVVQELDICLIVISHLRRPEGDRGHEDGARVYLGQLRGSHAIAQLADTVLAVRKVPDTDTVEVYVLKNRLTGETGFACTLTYDRDSGRLFETSSF